MPSATDDLGRRTILQVTSYDVTLDLTCGPKRFWSRTEVGVNCRRAGAAPFGGLHAVSIRRAALNGAGLDLTQDCRNGRLQLPPLAAEVRATPSPTAADVL